MVGRWIVSLSLAALLAGVGSGSAQAAPKAKPKPAAAKPAGKPAAKPAPAKPKKGKEADKEKEQERDKEQDKPDEPTTAEDAKAATKEDSVKAAGTATPKTQSNSDVKVKEDKEGVKTYKFETVEVEGRLKSPQVIYFLRRVRAEFEAGALGHRSFLGELSDSRRSAALR
jgi:hypothetical protein